MVIDIVAYTQEELAAFKPAYRQKICNAQVKKNALLLALEKDIAEAKRRLIDRGVFSSTIFEAKKAELTEICNDAIYHVQEALLFALQYANTSGGSSSGDGSGGGSSGDGSEGGSGETSQPPYPVDYTLSEEDRMIAVRAYYEETYTDATERFNVFAADEFARTYLGELYAPLYHYFEGQIA